MNCLLDTSTFLWLIIGSPRLSAHVRQLVRDPDVGVFLSVVSVWEILVKHKLGKLPLAAGTPPVALIRMQRVQHGIESLALDEEAIGHLSQLPKHHRDPFDRVLICQAISAGLTLLTPDDVIRQYPVRTAW